MPAAAQRQQVEQQHSSPPLKPTCICMAAKRSSNMAKKQPTFEVNLHLRLIFGAAHDQAANRPGVAAEVRHAVRIICSLQHASMSLVGAICSVRFAEQQTQPSALNADGAAGGAPACDKQPPACARPAMRRQLCQAAVRCWHHARHRGGPSMSIGMAPKAQTVA